MKSIANIIHKKTLPIFIFDSNGNTIYREYLDGKWQISKYDNGHLIYYEKSSGYWCKSKYDDQGNENYYEASDGVIIDNR